MSWCYAIGKDNATLLMCELCGATMEIPMPVSVDRLVELSRAFTTVHSICLPKATNNEPDQSPTTT